MTSTMSPNPPSGQPPPTASPAGSGSPFGRFVLIQVLAVGLIALAVSVAVLAPSFHPGTPPATRGTGPASDDDPASGFGYEGSNDYGSPDDWTADRDEDDQFFSEHGHKLNSVCRKLKSARRQADPAAFPRALRAAAGSLRRIETDLDTEAENLLRAADALELGASDKAARELGEASSTLGWLGATKCKGL
jgi:hypothetical protein